MKFSAKQVQLFSICCLLCMSAIYLVEAQVGGGAGVGGSARPGDNLGNHEAETNLQMNGFNIQSSQGVYLIHDVVQIDRAPGPNGNGPLTIQNTTTNGSSFFLANNNVTIQSQLGGDIFIRSAQSGGEVHLLPFTNSPTGVIIGGDFTPLIHDRWEQGALTEGFQHTWYAYDGQANNRVIKLTDGAVERMWIAHDANTNWTFSSFVFPSGDSLPLDVVGDAGIDTNFNLVIRDDTAARVYASPIKTWRVVVDTDGDWDGQVKSLGQAPADMGIEILEVRATTFSTNSGTLGYMLEERAYGSLNSAGTDIFAADQEADTDGEIETSFSNPGISAAAFVALVCGTGAETGTVADTTFLISYRLVAN